MPEEQLLLLTDSVAVTNDRVPEKKNAEDAASVSWANTIATMPHSCQLQPVSQNISAPMAEDMKMETISSPFFENNFPE